MRAVADMHLELNDISVQLTKKHICNGQNKSNTERIKLFLSLKCVDDIGKLEAELKNDKTLYSEYVSTTKQNFIIFAYLIKSFYFRKLFYKKSEAIHRENMLEIFWQKFFLMNVQ